jgi:hypothetical protein
MASYLAPKQNVQLFFTRKFYNNLIEFSECESHQITLHGWNGQSLNVPPIAILAFLWNWQTYKIGI